MSKLIIALVSGLFAVSVYAQPAKQAPAGDAVQPKLEKDQRKTETGKGLPTAKDSAGVKQKPAGDAVQPKLEQKQRKDENKPMPAAK
jgi:hypothetical protein